ncbi:hypothetical protein CB0940_10775 [Cercospora beticola]|uniref:F-box domain-containing protein n=1 Tax=Cercospora beticola TaxID=122368 RepID=A0A2G5HSY7_CERBT|nr:hypothetical protein CB0940_10775 [Cercospora beticola]PIA95649.1 hypothetical protein CB0940_10775 [Cercospora beticola]WPB07505.1 hypothetical protein RHO25_012166 [Cercospora beticola]CAK1367503.1 unnamed protein product [Cercospora beticola]
MAYFHNRLGYYRLDYSTYSTDELRSFVKNRTKQDSDEMTKDQLVAKLEALDDNLIFPFMSLPKDIRLIIYDELAFHPNILATSRGINEEAKPILDGQHTVTTLRIANRRTPPERQNYLARASESAISVNDGPWIHFVNRYPTIDEMDDQLALWPAEVKEARQLDIEVDCTHPDLYQMSKVVYYLATLLSNSSSHIRIRVHMPPPPPSSPRSKRNKPPEPVKGLPEELVRDMFWPLLRICPNNELVLEGFPRKSEETFREGISRQESPYTTAFIRYKTFTHRVSELIDLAKEAGIPWQCALFFSALKRANDTAHCLVPRCMTYPSIEDEWHHKLRLLETEVFAQGRFDRVQAAALEILEARKLGETMQDLELE